MNNKIEELGHIWNSRVCFDLKLHTFQAMVRSIPIYNTKTSTIFQYFEKKIVAMQRIMFSHMLHIKWTKKMNNEKLKDIRK